MFVANDLNEAAREGLWGITPSRRRVIRINAIPPNPFRSALRLDLSSPSSYCHQDGRDSGIQGILATSFSSLKPTTDKRSRLQVVAPYIKNDTVLESYFSAKR
jgi:hypothetical protein